MTDLILERRDQANRTVTIGGGTWPPPIDEHYWSYRVRLSQTQAIVGFPKFSTFGIGFAVEDDDYNTNLPYTCPAEQIYEHIRVNKGDASIADADCIEAIRLIQDAVRVDRAEPAVPGETADELLRWLVSLDDVGGPGAEARRTVTLTQIISRARAALSIGGAA